MRDFNAFVEFVQVMQNLETWRFIALWLVAILFAVAALIRAARGN